MRALLSIPLLIVLGLSTPSYSQSSGGTSSPQSDQCDANCLAGKVGLVAVPPSAALGYKKIMDEFGLADTEVYTGLLDQPMTEEEIVQTLRRIKESKAFERANVIVLDESQLSTKFLNQGELESKLRLYSAANKGFSRIAVRNGRLIRGGALGAAIGAVFLLVEVNDEPNVSRENLHDDLVRATKLEKTKTVVKE